MPASGGPRPVAKINAGIGPRSGAPTVRELLWRISGSNPQSGLLRRSDVRLVLVPIDGGQAVPFRIREILAL